jgi:hypothetical protein
VQGFTDACRRASGRQRLSGCYILGMRLSIWITALIYSLCMISPAAYCEAQKNPRVTEVFGNRSFDDEAIISIAGIEHDPPPSDLEIQRKLETTNNFSDVRVWTEGDRRIIALKEKVTWFIVPYYFKDAESSIIGAAAGKSGVAGTNGVLLGRAQTGKSNKVFSLLYRDEYFLDSRWILGGSLIYEDAPLYVYADDTIARRTIHQYHGGGFQFGYHWEKYLTSAVNTYIERHHAEEVNGRQFRGLQISHRLYTDIGSLYTNEGLVRGYLVRPYFEFTNPLGDIDFYKFGVSAQYSMILRGNFDWIINPRMESGRPLPRYQKFPLGGASLRSFPSQKFRDDTYFAVQNDFLLASWNIWKVKLRPLVYTDWAYIENGGRTGVGIGLNTYFRKISLPALQVYAGWGMHPKAFTVIVAAGPQFN